MKTLLTVITVFICFNCIGQISFKNVLTSNDSSLQRFKAISSMGTYSNIDTLQFYYKPDTIKCIALVSDTIVNRKWECVRIYNNNNLSTWDNPFYEQYKYIDKSDYSVSWKIIYAYHKSYFGEYFYLDENKKPLDKKYIIWQIKSIR